MKANKQILLITIVAFIIVAANIFIGCEKKVETEVTDIQARPFAVMMPVNTTTTLSVYFEPSNAANYPVTWETGHTYVATVNQLSGDKNKGVVTAHNIGETNIYSKTKSGGLATSTKVVVIPKEDENDYATLVPRFYLGAYNEQFMVGGIGQYLTVQHHSKNKIRIPINERVGIYHDEELLDCYINITYVADITKIANNIYNCSVGEIYVSIEDKYYPASIEATFSNNELDLIIKVKNVPEMEEILIHFKGNGSYTVGEGSGFWHC
jgi:hypothetical protein